MLLLMIGIGMMVEFVMNREDVFASPEDFSWRNYLLLLLFPCGLLIWAFFVIRLTAKQVICPKCGTIDDCQTALELSAAAETCPECGDAKLEAIFAPKKSARERRQTIGLALLWIGLALALGVCAGKDMSPTSLVILVGILLGPSLYASWALYEALTRKMLFREPQARGVWDLVLQCPGCGHTRPVSNEEK